MNLKLVTAPNAEPISLAEARQHLRVTSTAEDSLILSFVAAAREHAESYTRRRFITQTWDMLLDCFPWWCIEMPHAPLVSVTSIAYVDAAGATQTLDPTKYLVDTKTDPGRITPAYSEVWPITRWQMNAATIRFVCGYGDAAAVPQPIKTALRLLVQYFEQREGGEKLIEAAERILMPYRAIRF